MGMEHEGAKPLPVGRDGYVPKSAWGPGPWQEEPDRAEWRDEKTGLPCLAVRAPVTGAWCGYVGLYPDHPLHGQGYDGVDVDVHGGLTYAAACRDHICHTPQPGEPPVWWFGFDCSHFMDLSPAMEALQRSIRLPVLSIPILDLMPNPFREVYRSLDYVREECASLAAQLATWGKS